MEFNSLYLSLTVIDMVGIVDVDFKEKSTTSLKSMTTLLILTNGDIIPCTSVCCIPGTLSRESGPASFSDVLTKGIIISGNCML
jgi:hypothetical protein